MDRFWPDLLTAHRYLLPADLLNRCLTAATGDSTWQAHDILEWSFSSTYRDEGYNPPIIVNGEGAHECVNVTECVHRVEYEHYVRQNNWDRTYIMPDVEY